jgi:hypothetical protein
MTHSEAGGTSDGLLKPILSSPDWYKALTPNQLMAYVRHAYIWRLSGNTQLDSPEQTKRLVRWDGGEDSFGCKFTPVWPRITKMIISAGADPGVWVAAHFSPVAIKKNISGLESFEVRDITPSQLCGKLSEKIYIEYCEYLPQALQLDYETAGRTINLRLKSLAKLNLSKADQYECVICDEGYVTAPAFFRHGFATLFEATDAADKFLWPAAFEYEANQRLYSNVINWCITDKLLSVVEEIRTHWRRG